MAPFQELLQNVVIETLSLAPVRQDDLRLRPNFTLNLGVRYEMSTPPTEVNGKYGNLRNLTDTSPALGNPLFLNPTLANFEPRIGFAWDPFGGGKTSIRAGFGMFDILPLPAAMLQLLGGGAPFALQGTAKPLPAGTFPSGAFELFEPTGLGVDHIQFNPPRSYVMQWELAAKPFSARLSLTSHCWSVTLVLTAFTIASRFRMRISCYQQKPLPVSSGRSPQVVGQC